jgi:chorismate mutase/prephenate dehydratase
MSASRSPEEGEQGDSRAPSRKSSSKPPADSPSAAGGLSPLRNAINRIDESFLSLLAERRQVSLRVAESKVKNRAPVRDQKREEEMLVRLIHLGREQGLDAHYVTRIFHEIIDDSVRMQQEYLQRIANLDDGEDQLIRVAFQGIEGAYSHLAAQNFFSKDADRLAFTGFHTFAEAIKSVEDGRADRAMLPIQNTTSGAINEVYDLLLHTRLSIVGEEKFLVKHCLITSDKVPLESIRKVFSHYQAVAQCNNFLSNLKNCAIEFFTDTAMSVSKIKEEGDPTQAAIASEEAARMFGLHIIKRDIANQRGNFTRFVVLANDPIEVDPRIPCKTSIVMRTGQAAGSLLEPLQIFRDHDITLTMLESRPILNNPGEEMFYVDFEGNLADTRIVKALDDIRRRVRFLKVLGCYPSRDLPFTSPPIEALAGAAKPESAPNPVSPQSSRSDKTREDETGPPAAEATVDVRLDETIQKIHKTAAETRGKPPWDAQRLTSREYKSDDSVIELGSVRVGSSSFVVIAGPPSVESYEQILSVAREIKDHGGTILRGSCFRSRSSPFGEGLGIEGLEYLCEAGRTYQLPVATEVSSPKDVEVVAQKADVLEISADNMHNVALLREVGRMHRPVLLRRGLMSSVAELLDAAELIVAEGNFQVILCESGIRTYETVTRNTLDPRAVPILKSRTHLPVVVDPSLAAGEPALVGPLCLAAKALGSHGVVLEVHPNPSQAVSDGVSPLGFGLFSDIMANLFR